MMTMMTMNPSRLGSRGDSTMAKGIKTGGMQKGYRTSPEVLEARRIARLGQPKVKRNPNPGNHKWLRMKSFLDGEIDLLDYVTSVNKSSARRFIEVLKAYVQDGTLPELIVKAKDIPPNATTEKRKRGQTFRGVSIE